MHSSVHCTASGYKTAAAVANTAQLPATAGNGESGVLGRTHTMAKLHRRGDLKAAVPVQQFLGLGSAGAAISGTWQYQSRPLTAKSKRPSLTPARSAFSVSSCSAFSPAGKNIHRQKLENVPRLSMQQRRFEGVQLLLATSVQQVIEKHGQGLSQYRC